MKNARLQLAVKLSVSAVGGVWMSTLAGLLASQLLPLGYREIQLALGALGALLVLLGLAYLYPLVLGAALLLAVVGGSGVPSGIGVGIAFSVVFPIVSFYVERLEDTGRILVGRPSRLMILLTTLTVASIVFVIFVIAFRGLTLAFLGALRESLGALPYTMREFYEAALETRAGYAAVTAIVVGIVARVIYWIGSLPLEALTANPSSAHRELHGAALAEVEALQRGLDEFGRTAAASISTVLSVPIIPLIGTASAAVREVGLSSPYGSILALLLGFAVYALAWRLLQRVARALVSLGRERLVASWPSGLNPLAGALTILARSALVGVSLAFIAGLLLGFAALKLDLLPNNIGLFSYVLHSFAEALHIESAPQVHPFSFTESYARAYSSYLAKYFKSLDELADTLIRLLWGS